MIRITTADEPQLTMITVDGELTGDYVDAVDESCNQASSKGKPVWLFLRDISVIGENGRALLRRLAAKGVRLTASGLYTSYVVQLIQSDLHHIAAPVSSGVSTLVSTPDEADTHRSRNPRFTAGELGAREFLKGDER